MTLSEGIRPWVIDGIGKSRDGDVGFLHIQPNNGRVASKLEQPPGHMTYSHTHTGSPLYRWCCLRVRDLTSAWQRPIEYQTNDLGDNVVEAVGADSIIFHTAFVVIVYALPSYFSICFKVCVLCVPSCWKV